MQYYVFEMVMSRWSSLVPSIVYITVMTLNHKSEFEKIVKRCPNYFLLKFLPGMILLINQF